MKKPSLGYDGLYQLVVRDRIGLDAEGNDILSEPTVLVPWFGNLITNGGLDLLGSSNSDNLYYCRLGTGTTAEANGDTALGTQVGYTSTGGTGAVNGVAGDGSYIYRRVSRRFAPGTVSGHTLSEIGMGATQTGQLFSRSLLKDAQGAPITVTVTPDQALDVLYELRLYIDNQDTVANVTIDDAPCTVTMRPHAWPNGAGWAGRAGNIGKGCLPSHFVGHMNAGNGGLETQPSIASAIGNAGAGNTNYVTWNSYVTGTYQRTTIASFGLTQGNFATRLGAIVITSDGSWWTDGSAPGTWSWGFNPKLNKTSERLATIEVGLSWGRHVP